MFNILHIISKLNAAMTNDNSLTFTQGEDLQVLIINIPPHMLCNVQLDLVLISTLITLVNMYIYV